MGRQTPLMVVIQDKDTIQKVERLNTGVLGKPEAHTFYGAPTLIVVFSDISTDLGFADGNMVIGNLLNGANALGVDSCYIWRAREAFNTEEGKALKAKWNIPENYAGIGNVILGYGKSGGKKPAAPRKEDYVRKV